MSRPAAPLAARLRTPRAAAGIVFSLLYGSAIGLFRSAVPYDPADAGALVLLAGISMSAWLTLLFPAWVLVLSVHILCGPRAAAVDGVPPGGMDHVVRRASAP